MSVKAGFHCIHNYSKANSCAITFFTLSVPFHSCPLTPQVWHLSTNVLATQQAYQLVMCNTHFFVAHTLKYVYSIPCVYTAKNGARTYSPKNCERIFHWYTVTWGQLPSHKKCERTRRRHFTSMHTVIASPVAPCLPLT